MRVLRVLLIVLAYGSFSCTTDEGSDEGAGAISAEALPQHMAELTQVFKAGRLAEAYSRYLPPSYAHDIEELLTTLQGGLAEAEFQRLQGLLRKFGTALAERLRGEAEAEPALAVLATKADDLPEAFGLATYDEFRQMTVQGWLSHLEGAFLREWFTAAPMRERLGEQDFSLGSVEGDYAELKIRRSGSDGSPVEEKEAYVLVEGKWVTASMASNWERNITGLRRQLDEQLQRKSESPDVFLEQIAALEGQVGLMAAAAPGLLRSWIAGDRGAATPQSREE
jgi:hypothetical protein